MSHYQKTNKQTKKQKVEERNTQKEKEEVDTGSRIAWCNDSGISIVCPQVVFVWIFSKPVHMG